MYNTTIKFNTRNFSGFLDKKFGRVPCKFHKLTNGQRRQSVFKRSILVFKDIPNKILKKKKSGKAGAIFNSKENFEQNVNLVG